MRTLVAAASALSLIAALGACSDDGGGGEADTGGSTDTGVTDTGGEVDTGTTDTGADVGPRPTEISFTLTNGNPGGLSRWVQVSTNQGTPGWWNINEDSMVPTELRAHDACTIDNCDEGAGGCTGEEGEILELGPAQSISGSWDLMLFDTIAEGADVCEQPYDADEPSYRVQFCWSPEPPGADGMLPAGTISCTRLPFRIGVDNDIAYTIEGLSTCEDGVCDPGETSVTCPSDCTDLTATDVVLACNRYCRPLAECSDEFTYDACEAGLCAELQSSFGSASTDCLLAAVDMYACATALDTCEDLAAFQAGDTSNPCGDAMDAAAAACGE